MNTVIIIYVIGIILGFIIYFYNLFKLNGKKKLIGKIHYKWSSIFNLMIPVNWVIWIVVIAYLIWSLYLIITEPHRDNDYTPLVLFMIFLSFFPRWNTVVGSKGIVAGMKVILWEKLIEWKIIDKGKSKYLELTFPSNSLPSDIKTKRVQIPPKYFDDLIKTVKESIRAKE